MMFVALAVSLLSCAVLIILFIIQQNTYTRQIRAAQKQIEDSLNGLKELVK